MRFLKIIFALSFLFAFSACSDDDVTPTSTNAIVGVWNLADVYYEGISTTEVGEGSISTTFVGEGYDYDATIQFNEDGTSSAQGNYNVRLTTNFEGLETTQNIPGSNYLIGSTWELEGDQLMMADDFGNEATIKVMQLDENNLVLEFSTIQDLSQQGYVITSELDIEIKYTR